jgi:hypothetical protein
VIRQLHVPHKPAEINKLSFHIEKLFDAMLRGREKVFVARTAGEPAEEERESLMGEIRAAGYALSPPAPPPDGAIPRGLDRKTLRQFIDETRVPAPGKSSFLL